MSERPPGVPPVGTIVSGKYRIERVLGIGGMGVVVAAHHLRLDRAVALKFLLPDFRSAADVTARFEREARAAVRLTSPNVARVLDVDTLDDGSPFLVMELLEGRGVEEELHLRRRIPVSEAIGIVLDACSAMAEAHELGVVHRDLKPSNLFLAEQQGRRVVKVLDFGISKVTDDVSGSMTSTASAFGTPLYMSPEQVRSAKHVDGRTDIWSLGVVLYEMIAGHPPFDAPSATAILAAIIADKPKPLGDVVPDLPPGLSTAVMRALEKEPERRYADVTKFAAALEPYRSGSVSPSTLMTVTTLAPPPRKSRTALALLAIGVFGVAAVAATVVVRTRAGEVLPAPAEHVAAVPEPSASAPSTASPTPGGRAPAPTEPAVIPEPPSAAPSAESTSPAAATTAGASAAKPSGLRWPPPRNGIVPVTPRGTPPPREPAAPEPKPAPPKDDPSHL